MDLLPDRPEPAAFPAIAKALDTARQLPVWRRAPMKIGVCLRDGLLAATAMLEDYRQMRLFTIHLEAMGYRQLMLGRDDEMQGCDVVFVPLERAWGMSDRSLMAAAA